MFQQQISNKAKIKIAFAPILAILMMFVGLLACKKDIGQELDNPFNASAQNRTDVSPTVINGMLHFSTFGNFEAFIKSLQDKESDSLLVRNAYTALGVDVNAEFLPNLTDYPVCLLTEQSIGGYTSARKAEESVINAALNNGDDNIHSIVLSPFWKTALNVDQAVHIGNRIYKYYDNGGVVIILNNDWALYQQVKTLPFEAVQAAYNLIVTSDAREGWEKYFSIDADGNIQADKMIFLPHFTATLTADGKYTITNVSLVETMNGANTFKWIYADNSFSFGNSPDKAIQPTEALTLVINNGKGKQETYTGVESILACSTDNFTITYLANNQIRFELPGYTPGNPSLIKWVFSDGSTATSNPVTKTFTTNGTATCQLFRASNGTLACEFTKPYFVKCGDKKIVSSTKTFNYCNQRWKLDGSIWVLTGEAGCRVKYLRWRGALLGWQPANNQAACANISGTYIREVFNPNKNCIDVPAAGSTCLGNGTWPTSVSHTIPEIPNVFSKPGQLSAGLGINVCGVWHGWGFGGSPRLVLP